MLPKQDSSQLAPYMQEFNMTPTNAPRSAGVPYAPMGMGYPVMYQNANNYAGMSTGSNTSYAGAPQDTSAGDTAADAGASAGDGGMAY
jgi:hypothetical protein